MRRLIIGFICVALLLGCSTVLAESVSRVGRTIQSEIPVYLNGENLAVDAIVVDGASFLPVRVIANALGADVHYEDGVVHLTKVDDYEKLKEDVKNEIKLESKREEIQNEIDKLRTAIENNRKQIKYFESMIESEESSIIKETYETNIRIIEQVIQQQQQQIADLEAQLAALEQQDGSDDSE